MALRKRHDTKNTEWMICRHKKHEGLYQDSSVRRNVVCSSFLLILNTTYNGNSVWRVAGNLMSPHLLLTSPVQ
jgi:hypothetical protein